MIGRGRGKKCGERGEGVYRGVIRRNVGVEAMD